MLYFKKLGEGSTSLLILHGLFGSLDNWITLGRRYAEHFTVYLIDQRNHGRSPHYDRMDFDVMANDLAELMEHENIETSILLGHSMGGKAVLNFVRVYPEKTEKAIVADIAPRKYAPGHSAIIEALQSLDIGSLETRQDAEEALLPRIEEFGVRQFLLKNLKRKKEGGFEWKMNLEGIVNSYQNITTDVPINTEFDRPILFLKGENSNYISDEDEQQILTEFINADVQVIAKSGHWLHADNPDDFFDVSLNFMQHSV